MITYNRLQKMLEKRNKIIAGNVGNEIPEEWIVDLLGHLQDLALRVDILHQENTKLRKLKVPK